MEFVLPGLMIAGTGMQMYQQRKEGIEQQKMFDQRAAVMREEAEETRKAAAYEARETRKEALRFRGMQKAAFAKSGVRPSVGTPLLVQYESMAEFEKEATLIQETGATEASRLMSQAAWEKWKGKSSRRASRWDMGTTALTGAKQLGDYGYEKGWFTKPSAWARKTNKIAQSWL